jgi:hypothetical protein
MKQSDKEANPFFKQNRNSKKLISNLFYDTTSYDWLILMFNNIKDPFQELNVDDRILIPNL